MLDETNMLRMLVASPIRHTPKLSEIASAVADPVRLEVVRQSGALELPTNAVFDELTREASRLLDAPVAMLTIVDQYRDFIVGAVGLPEPFMREREITVAPSFCQVTVAQADTVIIEDTATDSVARLFPSVQAMGVRSHLGVPLKLGGVPIGNCCVIDYRPRQWTGQEISDLEDLAERAMVAIRDILGERARGAEDTHEGPVVGLT